MSAITGHHDAAQPYPQATPIMPGDLHKHFIVREIATGRERWLMNGDVRYAKTGDGFRDYRQSPEGEYFLVESVVRTHPWGALLRLDEVEPLPDGRGLWHPDWADSRALKLAMTYEGSWRQYADEIAGRS